MQPITKKCAFKLFIRIHPFTKQNHKPENNWREPDRPAARGHLVRRRCIPAVTDTRAPPPECRADPGSSRNSFASLHKALCAETCRSCGNLRSAVILSRVLPSSASMTFILDQAFRSEAEQPAIVTSRPPPLVFFLKMCCRHSLSLLGCWDYNY